jgi:hypothetical protein
MYDKVLAFLLMNIILTPAFAADAPALPDAPGATQLPPPPVATPTPVAVTTQVQLPPSAMTTSPQLPPPPPANSSGQLPPPVQPKRLVVTNGGKAMPISYEEGQQLMLDLAPKSKVQPSEDEKKAFNQLLKQNMPLSPEQVVELRQQIDTAQRFHSSQYSA